MDKFDEKLQIIFNEPVKKSNNYTHTIKQALYKANKKQTNFLNLRMKNLILATCCSLIIITNIVYGKELYNIIRNLFSSLNFGVDTAITNDYIQYIDMNYIESNGIKLKINNILMDDCNLDILFDCNTKKIHLDNINTIKLNDVTITDENNTPILYTNYSTNSADTKTDGYSIALEDSKNYKCQFSYNLFSNKGFPKSKKLYINIASLTINETIIDGSWNFTIDLNEKFFNRTNITYNIEDNNNNNNIKLYKAIMQPSGFNIRLQILTDEYLSSTDIAYMFKHIKIVDEMDKVYKVNSDSGIFMDQWLNLETTFSITNSQATNTLKLIIPFSESQEFIVVLKKNNIK